jgi:hypothetical protein
LYHESRKKETDGIAPATYPNSSGLPPEQAKVTGTSTIDHEE